MSDMMIASSVEASEQKPWMNDRVTDADVTITISSSSSSPITLGWTSVTITPSTSSSAINCYEGTTLSFSGSSSSNNIPELFTGNTGSASAYVYVTSINNYYVFAYLEPSGPPDSPTTGVWLGTSSGSFDPHCLVKA